MSEPKPTDEASIWARSPATLIEHLERSPAPRIPRGPVCIPLRPSWWRRVVDGINALRRK